MLTSTKENSEDLHDMANKWTPELNGIMYRRRQHSRSKTSVKCSFNKGVSKASKCKRNVQRIKQKVYSRTNAKNGYRCPGFYTGNMKGDMNQVRWKAEQNQKNESISVVVRRNNNSLRPLGVEINISNEQGTGLIDVALKFSIALDSEQDSDEHLNNTSDNQTNSNQDSDGYLTNRSVNHKEFNEDSSKGLDNTIINPKNSSVGSNEDLDNNSISDNDEGSNEYLDDTCEDSNEYLENASVNHKISSVSNKDSSGDSNEYLDDRSVNHNDSSEDSKEHLDDTSVDHKDSSKQSNKVVYNTKIGNGNNIKNNTIWNKAIQIIHQITTFTAGTSPDNKYETAIFCPSTKVPNLMHHIKTPSNLLAKFNSKVNNCINYTICGILDRLPKFLWLVPVVLMLPEIQTDGNELMSNQLQLQLVDHSRVNSILNHVCNNHLCKPSQAECSSMDIVEVQTLPSVDHGALELNKKKLSGISPVNPEKVDLQEFNSPLQIEECDGTYNEYSGFEAYFKRRDKTSGEESLGPQQLYHDNDKENHQNKLLQEVNHDQIHCLDNTLSLNLKEADVKVLDANTISTAAMKQLDEKLFLNSLFANATFLPINSLETCPDFRKLFDCRQRASYAEGFVFPVGPNLRSNITEVDISEDTVHCTTEEGKYCVTKIPAILLKYRTIAKWKCMENNELLSNNIAKLYGVVRHEESIYIIWEISEAMFDYRFRYKENEICLVLYQLLGILREMECVYPQPKLHGHSVGCRNNGSNVKLNFTPWNDSDSLIDETKDNYHRVGVITAAVLLNIKYQEACRLMIGKDYQYIFSYILSNCNISAELVWIIATLIHGQDRDHIGDMLHDPYFKDCDKIEQKEDVHFGNDQSLWQMPCTDHAGQSVNIRHVVHKEVNTGQEDDRSEPHGFIINDRAVDIEDRTTNIVHMFRVDGRTKIKEIIAKICDLVEPHNCNPWIYRNDDLYDDVGIYEYRNGKEVHIRYTDMEEAVSYDRLYVVK